MAKLGDSIGLECPACAAPLVLPLTQTGADLTSLTLTIDLAALRRHVAEHHPQEAAMPDQPSVGRVVHYVSHGSPVREDGTQAYTSQCRAAVITEVGDWPEGVSEADKSNIAVPVGLCVMNPSGLFFHSIADGGCMQSEVGRDGVRTGGTWHWPERADG